MCKIYDLYFTCHCPHPDLSPIKPCSAALESTPSSPHTKDGGTSICDILQPAKEAMVLRDPCAICALLGPGSAPGPGEGGYKRFFLLEELMDLPCVGLEGDGFGEEVLGVVLGPEVWDDFVSVLGEALPDVKVGRVGRVRGSVENVDAGEEVGCEGLNEVVDRLTVSDGKEEVGWVVYEDDERDAEYVSEPDEELWRPKGRKWEDDEENKENVPPPPPSPKKLEPAFEMFDMAYRNRGDFF